MSYDIVYGQGALDRLYELNMPEVLGSVDQAMSRLASDPIQHSQRALALHASPDGRLLRAQQFDFHYHGDAAKSVHFRAHFYYGEDEQKLCVFDLVPTVYWRF